MNPEDSLRTLMMDGLDAGGGFTQDSAPGEIHSLRCEFELAYQNVTACDLQGHSIEEGITGSFMRSGVTMTEENYNVASNGGLYIEGGEVKLNQAWRDFSNW
jgi:hypothetical protein